MTLSVIDAGQLEVRPTVFELRPVVELAASEIDQCPVVIDVGGDVTVHADPTHVHRIVSNLLRNAAKYGAEPIAVRASRNGGSVEVAVTDEGPGVADDVAARMFERFSRSARTKSKDGAGLGLSIVRELAQLNRGTVTYERHRPRGSCFRVQLPPSA
jgi:signal transduction histidine kinase